MFDSACDMMMGCAIVDDSVNDVADVLDVVVIVVVDVVSVGDAG